jgi:hypothetical protein
MAGWLAGCYKRCSPTWQETRFLNEFCFENPTSKTLSTALLPRHCPLKHINFDYSSLFLQLRALRIKDLKKKRKEKLIIII